MNASDYEFLAGFLKRRSGYSVTTEKAQLIEGRLKPVALRHGFKTVGTLVRELKKANETVSTAVVNAMTINDTSFFRDHALFAAVRSAMLPALAKLRAPDARLRVWCAAASTGQEPYSLAMIVDGMPQFPPGKIEILATDINADLLERAREGLYDQFEMMRGLPIQMLAKYFNREGDEWRIAEALRKRIHFRSFNLLDSFDSLGTFDIIFCRNVLFYFDAQVKQDVLARLWGALAADGYLALGGAETLTGLGQRFAAVEGMPGLYRKVMVAHPAGAVIGG